MQIPSLNVLFEFGYFYGHFAKEQVAIIKYGDFYLPSDLGGYVHIFGSSYFKRGAIVKIAQRTEDEFNRWVARRKGRTAKQGTDDERLPQKIWPQGLHQASLSPWALGGVETLKNLGRQSRYQIRPADVPCVAGKQIKPSSIIPSARPKQAERAKCVLDKLLKPIVLEASSLALSAKVVALAIAGVVKEILRGPKTPNRSPE